MKYFPYEKENITVWKMLSMSISQRTCYKQLWNVQNVVSGSRILRGCILSRIIEDRNSWSLRPERLRLVGCLFMVVGFILLGMRGDRRSTYLVLGYLIHYWGWVAHVLGNIGRGRHHCQSWPSVSIQDPWIQNIIRIRLQLHSFHALTLFLLHEGLSYQELPPDHRST